MDQSSGKGRLVKNLKILQKNNPPTFVVIKYVMENYYDKIAELGVILDPEIENYVIKNNLTISKSKNGYVSIQINKKKVLISRFIINPLDSEMVDHINRDPTDNRLCNLRICDPFQNQWNRPITKLNKSRTKGIYRCNQSMLWIAEISARRTRYRKKSKYKEVVDEWREEMMRKLHGRFANKIN